MVCINMRDMRILIDLEIGSMELEDVYEDYWGEDAALNWKRLEDESSLRNERRIVEIDSDSEITFNCC